MFVDLVSLSYRFDVLASFFMLMEGCERDRELEVMLVYSLVEKPPSWLMPMGWRY